MTVHHVNGINKGSIRLYALSTCGWCKKTKNLLNTLGVAYDYIDVDYLMGQERTKVIKEIEEWNPHCSFPTLVINNTHCIVGFKEKDIRKVIGS